MISAHKYMVIVFGMITLSAITAADNIQFSDYVCDANFTPIDADFDYATVSTCSDDPNMELLRHMLAEFSLYGRENFILGQSITVIDTGRRGSIIELCLVANMNDIYALNPELACFEKSAYALSMSTYMVLRNCFGPLKSIEKLF